MAVDIKIVDTKFFAELSNGTSFSLSQTDFANHLKGSVMERIKAVHKFHVSWHSVSESNTKFEYIDGQLGLLICEGVDFLADGFWVDDKIVITREGTNPVASDIFATISAINGDTLNLKTVPGFPSNFDTEDRVIIRGRTDANNLTYKYNFIENEDNFDLQDPLTNSERGFLVKNADMLGEEIQFLNLNKATHQGRIDVNVSNRLFDNVLPKSSLVTVQVIEVEHEFILNPYFLDEELSNLQNNIIPERLSSGDTLKYIAQVEFRTQYNNPNTSKTIQFDKALGSVAWFEESFNGFQNSFSVENLTYKVADTMLPTNALTKGERVVVEFDLKSNNNVFALNTPVVLYHSLLPDFDTYSYSATETFEELWAYDAYREVTGHVGGGESALFKSVSVTLVNNSTIHVKTTFTPNNNLNDKITENTNYLLAVGVGNPSLDVNNTDKVVMKVDVRNYDIDADVPGLFQMTKFNIYPHTQEINETNAGFHNYIGWIEDGIVVDYEFDLDRSKNAFLDSLQFKLVGYHKTQNTYFDIDSTNLNLSTQVFSNNVQQIEIDETKGFNLQINDQFNNQKLTTDTFEDNKQTYKGTQAFKIDWKHWVKLEGVPTDFYNADDSFQGFNKRASNYINEDYELRILALAEVRETVQDVITEYAHFSQTLEIYDYDEIGANMIDFTTVIETFKLDNTPLLGSVLADEDVIVKATFIPPTPITVSDYYGIMRIEEQQQSGFDIDELSSLRLFPNGNRLLPIAGENLLKIEEDNGNIVLTCRTNSEALTNANYKLSAKIELKDGATAQPRAYSNDYSIAYS